MQTASSLCRLVLVSALLIVLAVGSLSCGDGQPVVSTTTTTEFTATLVPFPQATSAGSGHYKWGYLGRNGNWVISPRFDAASFFVEGLAPVELEGKWGYIDEAGSMVIPAQFTEAYYFRGGLARVATGPRLSGNNGAPVATASGYGFIDKTGRMIIPAKWDAAADFSEGLAAVMTGSACGFVNTHGKLVIPTKFDVGARFPKDLRRRP